MSSDYITIQLSKGQETVVEPIDADLKDLRWYAKDSGNTFYAYRGIWEVNRTKQVPMHRIIVSRMLERELLSDEFVDHINGNTLDNRRSNLRLVDAQTNTFNTRKHSDNKSGYKGVVYDKANNKWRSEIMHSGKKHWLGRFDTPEEAYEAYCNAAKLLHGEYARLD